MRFFRHAASEQAVGGHASGEKYLFYLILKCRVYGFADQHVHYGVLEAGGDIGGIFLVDLPLRSFSGGRSLCR
jgi:hypothetical protein